MRLQVNAGEIGGVDGDLARFQRAADGLKTEAQLIDGIVREVGRGELAAHIVVIMQRAAAIAEFAVMPDSGRMRFGADILLHREVGDGGVVRRVKPAAVKRSVGLVFSALDADRTPRLEAGAERRFRAHEVWSVSGAGDGIVRMRGDHQNSAVGEHVIDDAHMAVDVVGENAGLHRAAFDFHRIKIVEQFAVAPFRIGAEHRRRHFAADACDERRRVADGVDDLAASGDDVAFARIAQIVARAIGGAHGVLVGEGKPVLPGVIGAQHIGHVGAVAGKMRIYG